MKRFLGAMGGNGGGSASRAGSRSSSSRMWSQPATARQIATLKSSGSFDGKYYSKGRAGQAIGASARRGLPVARITKSTVISPRQVWAGTDAAELVRLDRSSPPVAGNGSEPSRHSAGRTERTNMSQLVPVRNSLASRVDMSANVSVNVEPFDYIGDLEAKHLAAVASQIGTTNPRQVHALEKGWALAKVTMAQKLARAQNEIVTILWDAPSGIVASPEAAAQEILWNACSADLEKQLLESTHKARGTTRPSHVLDLLLAEVDHRIEMAKIYAKGKVDVAKIQAARPPQRPAGYEPCWGEVTAVKPFGAFVTLPSGEAGLLHISELQALNGGRWVEDATAFVNVGQSVYVRVNGKDPEGKLSFALASEG